MVVLSVSLQVSFFLKTIVSLDDFLVKHNSHNFFLITHFFLLFNFDSKFSNLTCFDQYLAVAKCANIVKDQKAKQPRTFGLVSPAPTVNQVEFLYDLYELAGDVHGLLDFVAFVLMPSEDDILTTQVALVKSVVGTLPTKSTIVVAMLRKYHGSLMLLPEHTTRIFRG